MTTDSYQPIRTLAAVVLFGIAIGAASYALFRLAHFPFGLPHLAILAFWTTLSAAMQIWQEAGLIGDPKGFMFRFMVGLVVKLLVALSAVAAILALRPRDEAVPLALLFTGLYLAFLAFSTIRLSSRSRTAPHP